VLGAGQAEINRQTVFRCDDFEGLRDAACRGLGVARLASWIVADDIARGKLAAIPARNAKAGEQGIFVLRSLAKPTATYRAFVAAVKEGMRAAAG